MNFCKLTFLFCFYFSSIFAAEFTISSYNCGGLSDHYDYLRAASMQKIMQQRYEAEPEWIKHNENIQKLALKILFTKDLAEKLEAENEWEQKGYQIIFGALSEDPSSESSLNANWSRMIDKTITPYQIRPIVIYDKEVDQALNDHLSMLTNRIESETALLLDQGRAIMAKQIFANSVNHDIICSQEADYLDKSLFPENYEVLLSDTKKSINGIAWNKNRFELIETIGNIWGRAFAVQLLDKENGKTVLVASGHLSGCNPYRGIDSARGDIELKKIVGLLDQKRSDVKIVGMDSNVTSIHPRLSILKNASYELDYSNELGSTCTNPHQVFDTRIDWIAMKTDIEGAKITNISIPGVDLNNIQNNLSDHVPIASKINY